MSASRLTARQAARRLGVSPSLIQLWAKDGCPDLGGTRLQVHRIPDTRKGVTYDPAQIDAVALARSHKLPGNPSDYLSYPEARDRFGFRQAWLYDWRDQGCCYLEGERLQARQEYRKVGNNVRLVWTYYLPQLKLIAEARGRERRGVLVNEAGTWFSAKVAEKTYRIFDATLGE